MTIFFFTFMLFSQLQLMCATLLTQHDLNTALDPFFGQFTNEANRALPTCTNTSKTLCYNEEGAIVWGLDNDVDTHQQIERRDETLWYLLVGASLTCSGQAIEKWNIAFSTCVTRNKDGHWYGDRACVTSILTAALITAGGGISAYGVWATHSKRDTSLETYTYEVGDLSVLFTPVQQVNSHLFERQTLAASANAVFDVFLNGTLTMRGHTVFDGNTSSSYMEIKPNDELVISDTSLVKRLGDANDAYFTGEVGLKFNYCHTSGDHRVSPLYDWDGMWSLVNNDLQYIDRCWGYDIGVVDSNDRVNGWPVLMGTGKLILETQPFGDNFETCDRYAFHNVARADDGESTDL